MSPNPAIRTQCHPVDSVDTLGMCYVSLTTQRTICGITGLMLNTQHIVLLQTTMEWKQKIQIVGEKLLANLGFRISLIDLLHEYVGQ